MVLNCADVPQNQAVWPSEDEVVKHCNERAYAARWYDEMAERWRGASEPDEREREAQWYDAFLRDGEEHAERRLDSDGEAYTFDEFCKYYGGTAEWEAATLWEQDAAATSAPLPPHMVPFINIIEQMVTAKEGRRADCGPRTWRATPRRWNPG